MEKHFESTFLSQKYHQKNQNGDAQKIEYLQTLQYLSISVADGVGSCPCDWKASDSACKLFGEYFQHKISIMPIEEAMYQAITDCNQYILDTQGDCEGMKTTFSVLIWDLQKDTIHYVNIGDSRIYLIKQEHLKLVKMMLLNLFIKVMGGRSSWIQVE